MAAPVAVPPFAYHLRGTEVAAVAPQAAETQAQELPQTLVIPPGVYRWQGRNYELTKEGLYRFLYPPKDTQQRIVFQKDTLAAVSALCWLHSHGYREDRKGYDDLKKRALTGKLIMTCGPFSNFSRKLLTEIGVRARAVNSMALTRNGFDDGHVLVEVALEGRWVLIDVDQHATFWHGGRRLSLLEMMSRVRDDDYRIGPLALSVPLAIGDFVDATDGYDYGMWMETNIHSEQTLRSWYRRIMAAALISRNWTTETEADREEVERSRPGFGVNYLPRKEFELKFYSENADEAPSRAASEAADYHWTQITLTAPFAARDGAGALAFKGRMWLLGGWNPSDKAHFPKICNSEVWSSADGLDWRLENPQAPWEGRHTAGYVVHDGKMWIVGGDGNQRHYQNDVWNSEDGIQWNLVCGDVPWRNRVLHYTLVHDGKIWVMGGQSLPQFAGEAEAFYNDVWNSADGVRWTRVTEHAPWPPRGMIGGSVVFKGRMWILGGGTYDTPTTPQRHFYSDVWSSADGVTWKRHLESAPWAPRQYHDVGVFDGRMWVLEGYNKLSGNRNDVHYSSDGVNWHELPGTPWAPRHAASVFTFQDGLWMVAGNNMFPDVWKLTRGKGR